MNKFACLYLWIMNFVHVYYMIFCNILSEVCFSLLEKSFGSVSRRFCSCASLYFISIHFKSIRVEVYTHVMRTATAAAAAAAADSTWICIAYICHLSCELPLLYLWAIETVSCRVWMYTMRAQNYLYSFRTHTHTHMRIAFGTTLVCASHSTWNPKKRRIAKKHSLVNISIYGYLEKGRKSMRRRW